MRQLDRRTANSDQDSPNGSDQGVFYDEVASVHASLCAADSGSSAELQTHRKTSNVSTASDEDVGLYDVAMPISIARDMAGFDSETEARRQDQVSGYSLAGIHTSSRKFFADSSERLTSGLPPRDPPDGQETGNAKSSTRDLAGVNIDDPLYMNLPHDRLPVVSDDDDDDDDSC